MTNVIYTVKIKDSIENIVNFYMLETDIGTNLLSLMDKYKECNSKLNDSYNNLCSKPDKEPLDSAIDWLTTGIRETSERYDRLKTLLKTKPRLNLNSQDKKVIVLDYLAHEGIRVTENGDNVTLNGSSVQHLTMNDLPNYIQQIVLFYNFKGDSDKLTCFIKRMY